MPDQSTTPRPVVFDSRWLPVGDGHELYIEQSGNPDGLPAVLLHGGPGAGCQSAEHGLFDSQLHRAILFDQRGAGRSRPKGSLEANSTEHLVADLERIRVALGVERWLLVGGSWGSLLALAYAQAHRERVLGLVLRAVFAGSATEVDWALVRGPQWIRPELWQAFLTPLPESERSDPLAAYGRRLLGDDEAAGRAAARIWHDYEQALALLQPRSLTLPGSLEEAARSSRRPDTPTFEWHYIRNGFFLRGADLLARSVALGDLPGVLVQGRYDLLCPPVNAHRLAHLWPGSRLQIVEAAGHSLFEPAIRQAVRDAIDELTSIVGDEASR